VGLRRILLSATLLGGCIWCVGVVQQVYSEEKKIIVPRYQPVAPVHDLMEAQEDHFNAVRKNLREKNPNFRHMAAHAYVVAELSNVNQFQSDKPDYRAWAIEARDGCVQLAEAAKAKDLKKCKMLFRKVGTTCVACHDEYQ